LRVGSEIGPDPRRADLPLKVFDELIHFPAALEAEWLDGSGQPSAGGFGHDLDAFLCGFPGGFGKVRNHLLHPAAGGSVDADVRVDHAKAGESKPALKIIEIFLAEPMRLGFIGPVAESNAKQQTEKRK
jgi:hypothetical protein